MKLQRRDFLSSAAGAAALGLLPGWLRAAAASPDPTARAFAEALAREPWLLGFATASREQFDASAERVHGRLPEGLRGTLFRNGPARHELAGRRYQHWFDGDGLVQAFRLHGGRVEHRARFVETDKYARERAAGRPLEQGFGTTWPDLPPPRDAAAGNPANISVLWHAGRLLALWEAADAYALDERTLETRGRHVWSPETAGVPFSAHPRREPDGTLWNFGSAPWANTLVLYRIGADGRLREAHPLRIERPSYLHDFAVTERHLVFLMPPLHFEPAGQGATFLDSHRWDPKAPTRILLVDKADLSSQRWIEAPASFVFHFANAWEESGGLRIDACLYPDARVMFEDQAAVMWGRPPEQSSRPRATTLTVELASGRVASQARDLESEFPGVDPARVGRRHRHVVALARLPGGAPQHPLLNALVREDVEGGASQSYRFPDAVIPEEHLFVTAPEASPGAGWILGTALDVARGVTELSVFDAEQLAEGPVSTWRLPYALPLGLHGRFAAGV